MFPVSGGQPDLVSDPRLKLYVTPVSDYGYSGLILAVLADEQVNASTDVPISCNMGQDGAISCGLPPGSDGRYLRCLDYTYVISGEPTLSCESVEWRFIV